MTHYPVYSDPLLTSFTLLPFVAAVIASIVGLRSGKAAAAIASISFLPIIIYALYNIWRRASYLVYWGDLPPPLGSVYLACDGISNLLALAIALVGFCLDISSYIYMKHRFHVLHIPDQWHVYYLLFPLCCASMVLLVYSYNLIIILILLDVALITSALLIAFYGYDYLGKTRGWVALLYLMYGIVASVFYLAGFAIIALQNGTLDLNAIKAISMPAWVLILIASIVKFPTWGPHVWIPWAHGLHPTPVAALVIGIVGLAGFILARLYTVSPWFFETYRLPILLYAVIGGIMISLGVFRHEHYKWLLAQSTAAHSCYLLSGVVLGPYGVLGAMLHYASHLLGKSTLFMTAASIITHYERYHIYEMGGVQTYLPLTGGAAVLGWMALTGIVTITLIAKLCIFTGLIQTLMPTYGLWTTVVIAILLISLFVLGGYYAFWTLKAVFYGQPRIPFEKVHESRTLMIPVIILGLWPVILLIPPTSGIICDFILKSVATVMGHV